jgi:ubiquinone/menaquinone biosynthesis C-methylase UbiE
VEQDSVVMEEKSNDNIALWDRYYKSLTDSYLFPNEYVVRAFLGTYPNLTMNRNYRGAKVCDVSCGDGRNLVLLNKLGLELFATEVSQEICEITRRKLLAHSEKIAVDVREGRNNALPFEDGFFDYMLSWNACYYMESENSDISDHIREYSRVLKRGGYLVACIPTPECATLREAEKLGNNLIRINTKTRWNILNGSIYYQFESFDRIEEKFGEEFTDFQKATIMDDCFGFTLAYFVFVCRKR